MNVGQERRREEIVEREHERGGMEKTQEGEGTTQVELCDDDASVDEGKWEGGGERREEDVGGKKIRRRRGGKGKKQQH